MTESGIRREQMKRIYVLARSLNLTAQSGGDDELHTMVLGMTGKKHISDMTEAEADSIITEIMRRMRGNMRYTKPESGAAGVTEGQRTKVWRLMYRLEELDPKKSEVKAGVRLRGIINRILHTDVGLKNPFAWMSYKQASVLIEAMKGMVDTAERQQKEVGYGGTSN